ncbi:MAG: aldehyde dehydrogenase EutE [Synergistaceae bacterium]|jgi:propionaldehyde dehydrogenase|nr:aldehyde dehydrogenase EutE [Synergistaceae bacterium]
MSQRPDIDSIVQRVLSKLGDALNEPGGLPGTAGCDVDGYVAASAKAQEIWHRDFGLERRSQIVEEIRADLRPHIESLAKMAVEETGMGNLRDKIIKKSVTIEKTPGPESIKPNAITGDKGLVLEEHAPYGVIASIIPCTNPVATVIHNAICMISGGNSVIFAPHPKAVNVSLRTVGIIAHTLRACGAPDNLVSALTDPSMDNLGKLMKHPKVRLISATGGPGVVHAALTSGKPAVGAGPGNPPVVVDETANLDIAGKGVVNGASFDNNLLCVCEKELIVVNCVADDLKKRMLEHGAYELRDRKEIELLERAILNGDNTPNKNFVGKDATYILEKIGLKVPLSVRLIIVETTEDHPFAQEELLMPVLPLIRVADFEEALAMAKRLEHGFHHSAVIYSTNIDHMSKMAREIETTMFVKNAPAYCSLGADSDCPVTLTIATATGQGATSPESFCRMRRCVLSGAFRII